MLDTVKLARFDDAAEGRGPFTTSVIAHEQEILATNGHAPQRPLYRIIVDAELTFFEVERQAFQRFSA